MFPAVCIFQSHVGRAAQPGADTEAAADRPEHSVGLREREARVLVGAVPVSRCACTLAVSGVSCFSGCLL